MGGKPEKKVPRFHGLRIYLSSIILYYGLVLPFILILYIKYAPKFNENKIIRRNQPEIPFDTLGRIIDTMQQRFSNSSNIVAISDSLINNTNKC